MPARADAGAGPRRARPEVRRASACRPSRCPRTARTCVRARGPRARLAQRSAADATRVRATGRRLLQRFSRALHPVLNAAPPRLGTDAWRDRAALLRTGLAHPPPRAPRHARAAAHRRHERPRPARGALRSSAAQGRARRSMRCSARNFGPRSPGTVLSLLYRVAASQRRRVAGAAAGRHGRACPRRSARAATRRRRGDPHRRRRSSASWCSDDRAAGWCWPPARRSRASTVISNADPKTTFLELLGS